MVIAGRCINCGVMLQPCCKDRGAMRQAEGAMRLDKGGNYYTLSTGFTTYTYQNNSYTNTIGTVQKFNANGKFVKSFGHFGNYSKYLVDDNQNVFIIGHDTTLDSVRPVLCKYDSS